MKKELFEEKIKELTAAFRCDLPTLDSLKIYWKFLNHIEDNKFKKICTEIIKTERFFPAISVFRTKYKDFGGENYPEGEREYVA